MEAANGKELTCNAMDRDDPAPKKAKQRFVGSSSLSGVFPY